jgi:hypothetical protein
MWCRIDPARTFTKRCLAAKEMNMVRFLAIAAVVGTTLVLANGSEGANNKGPSGYHSGHSYSGHSFPSHYRNWSSWRWDSHYRCYFYGSGGYFYYWYAPASCYYQVSYATQYPPTQTTYQQSAPSVAPVPIQVSTPIQVTNTNTNTLVNGFVPPVGSVASVGPIAPGPQPKGP